VLALEVPLLIKVGGGASRLLEESEHPSALTRPNPRIQVACSGSWYVALHDHCRFSLLFLGLKGLMQRVLHASTGFPCTRSVQSAQSAKPSFSFLVCVC
jgi:hypothetical protein